MSLRMQQRELIELLKKVQSRLIALPKRIYAEVICGGGKSAMPVILAHFLIRVLKVADLGIARDNENGGSSRTGARLGTAEYMSPEQIRGTNIDARSDIYACGIVLYELLHGSVPFTGPSEYDVFEKAVSEPVNLEVLRGAASDAVRAAVGCALAKDPAGRWPSADTFRAALLAAK